MVRTTKTAKELADLKHAAEHNVGYLWWKLTQIPKGQCFEEMSTQSREFDLSQQRSAEESLDRLASLVDRLFMVVEREGYFESLGQARAVEDALARLEDAFSSGNRPPTAGPLRQSPRAIATAGGNTDPLFDVANAILTADPEELADVADDLDAGEYELAEDRAGWRLGEILMEHRLSPTLRQVELAMRVGRRYERAAERDQRVAMPEVCVERFRHYRKFKKGDWIYGARNGERHQYGSRDRVVVRGESNPLKQGGYVCDETAKMVWIMTETSYVFSKRKRNRSVVLHSQNGTVAMERNEDYRRVVLEELLRE